MTSNLLAHIIASKDWCVADGATGTNLFALGLETGFPPELWSVERPDEILWLHISFLDAEPGLILINSFGGTSYWLNTAGPAAGDKPPCDGQRGRRRWRPGRARIQAAFAICGHAGCANRRCFAYSRRLGPFLRPGRPKK